MNDSDTPEEGADDDPLLLNGEGINDETDRDRENEWIYLKGEDWFRCIEVLESVMKNVQFSLDEPIALGFLPYFTHTWMAAQYCRQM